MDTNYLSKERLEELKKELEQLKTVKRMEIADGLKRAKEYGDLSENFEYAEVREEQARVEARIGELEEIIRNATVITKSHSVKKVQVGARVTVKKDGKTVQYAIVGSNESDPLAGKISNESPIGKALIGREAGDKVEVHAPSGKTVYEIIAIE